MKSFVALMIGACSWLFAAAALGADWYVDAAAASGGDGSMASPFATINAVLAGLQRGDTVWIAGGTYSETVNFWMLPGSSGQTTIRAMSGATPVIDGTAGSSAAGFVLQAGTPDMTFEGLTIQNSAADGIEIYQADGCQVVDCTTTGITGNAVTFYYASDGLVSGSKLQGGVGGRRSSGTIVENSELYGCTNHEGITLYDDSQNCQYLHNVIHDNYSVNLYLDSISHSTIDGNLIYESAPGNDLVGIELSDEMYSDLPAPVNSYNTIINNVIVGHQNGIQFWSGTFPASAGSGLIDDVIANNTLVNNLGAVKWDSGAHRGTIVENNIVVVAASMTPSYLLQANSTTGVSLSHNLWYAPSLTDAFLWGSGASPVDHAAWVAASGQGASDVLADPMFAAAWAAPPATNLELAMGSPAIDTGATLAAVTHDFLGAPRPYGAGYDIGAFEYGSTPVDGGAAVGPLGDAAPSVEEGDGATESQTAIDGGKSTAPDSGTVGADTGAEGGALEATSSNAKSGGCSCSTAASPGPEGVPSVLALTGLALTLLWRRTLASSGRRSMMSIRSPDTLGEDSMKRTFAIVALLAAPVACSSSSSGGGSPTGSSSDGGGSSSGGSGSSGAGSSSGAGNSSGAGSSSGSSSGSGTGSSGGGTAGGATAACIAGLSGSAACASCETGAGGCAALVTGQIKTGCSDYLACVCPNGAAAPASQSVVTSCASMAQETSCKTATSNLTGCGQSNCASSCSTAMAYACTLLQTCCEGLGCYDAGCEMQACLTVVNNNPTDEQLCASDLYTFQCPNIPDGGLDAGN